MYTVHERVYFNFVPLYPLPSTGQNPTGRTMSNARRRNVMQVCSEFFIVADEVYHMLSYAPKADQADSFSKLLQETPDATNIVSIASVSKILSPGLRVGWVHSTKDVVSTITSVGGIFKSSGCLCQFSSHVVRHLLAYGRLTQHLIGLTQKFTQKRDAAVASLDEHLRPLGVTFTAPVAGYFVWCELPSHLTVTDLERVLEGKVLLTEGGQFYWGGKAKAGGSMLSGDVSPCHSVGNRVLNVLKATHFRLCFIAVSEASFRLGVEHIADGVKQLIV